MGNYQEALLCFAKPIYFSEKNCCKCFTLSENQVFLSNEQILLTVSGSLCEKKRLFPVSKDVIFSISSLLSSKSNTLMFSIILSLLTVFGITTISL